MKIAHEVLPADDRPAWSGRVRDVVVKRPELARLF
jgi:hypothetical protein